ncbi:MAG: hypothetical protein EU529_06825 [Promethearchaeota archaeon]|nr:MAG: hypothetical protein EU529_06825 [Candidatus Lokiarchaeota archaeon]
MQYCKNCGEVISEHQFDNFNGICSACVRLNLSQKSSPSDNMFRIILLLLVGLGIFIFILMFLKF